MELRNIDEVRKLVSQSISLQTYIPAQPENVKEILKWCMEILSTTHSLPPIGFVADIGHIIKGIEPKKAQVPEFLSLYEDQVLGRVYSNYLFSECAELIRAYQGRNYAKGIAFIISQICKKTKIEGMEFSPGIMNTLLGESPESFLQEHEEIDPFIMNYYETLVNKFRGIGDILYPEDLLEIQSGVFLDEEGDKLAFRQVFKAVTTLEKMLPRYFTPPVSLSKETPTAIFEENTYPVGGFSSITNRGSIENILHSQLAYIEENETPDMFDIKYLRDELLYYSRDENEFLRKRRNFIFVFHPDILDKIHFKDAGLSYQRAVFFIAFIYITFNKVIEELSNDALKFHFVFMGDLKKEFEILCRIFKEQMMNGTINFYYSASEDKILDSFKEKYSHVDFSQIKEIEGFCKKIADKSMCHCISFSSKKSEIDGNNFIFSNMKFNHAIPEIKGHETFMEDLLMQWADLLKFFISKLIF